MSETKVNIKKIQTEIESILDELGSVPKNSNLVGGGATVQQLKLPNGREAQIKIEITTDKKEFDEVCK